MISLLIPYFIEMGGVILKRPLVVAQFFVRGGLQQISQDEFHRLLVLLRVVEGHRQKNLEGTVVWKLAHPSP